ncbi:MAG: hypothetical protein ABI587_02935 [Gemmatimonadales bacterium]
MNLVFLACNRNDYDLQLRRVSARLAVTGRAASPLGRSDNYTLPTRTMSEIMVTVSLADSAIAADQEHRRFELLGETTVTTPGGDRVVAWQQRGQVWKRGDSLHWVGEQGVACRPGLSQLPTYFAPLPKIGPLVKEPLPSMMNPDSNPPTRPSRP